MEKNLGHATAYGYAKSKGYSGTEDEFAELMADYASVGQSAAQSAEQAAASATSASGSAATASQAAQTATSKASEAVTAAGTATTKASEASTSADTASTAAQTATDKASEATTAATTATTKASEASESAATASTAKTDAETARDAAAQSASRAEQSAESIDPDEFDRKIYAAFATDTATGAIAHFTDGADNIPMKDVLVHVNPVQDLHGYDNPWPAGGGVNQWDEDWESGYYNRTTGKKAGDSSTTYFRSKNYIPCAPNTSYYFKNPSVHASNDTYYAVLFYDADKNYLSAINSGIGNTAQTTPQNAQFMTFYIEVGTSDATYHNDIAINYPATVTTYFPYSNICPITGWTECTISHSGADMTNPTTYSITFPSEADTVYGGTLDVTNGVLTVDRAIIASYAGETLPTTWISDRDVYSEGATPTTGAQVCYKLATPITYQLTPQEITSLLGTNNLWADTGDSDVEYRADMKMYITKKITEAVSALS